MIPMVWLPASLDGCALYRMFFPHLRAPDSVFAFNYGQLPMKRFEHCRVAVVQRLCSQQNFEAMLTMKRMGMKVIYDLDDNMWQIPSYNPAQRLFRQFRRGFEICAVQSDLITVSTEHLKVMVQQHVPARGRPPIEVVKNTLDFDWVRPLRPELQRNREEEVRVGWAGSQTHTGDTAFVFKTMPDILKEQPEMRLELGMAEMPEHLKDHPQVRQRQPVPVAEWLQRWVCWQWDVSLAPLEQNSFNRSKSNIKAIEAAAIGIPCLMSRVAPYQDFCRDSEKLQWLLVDKQSEWKEKILELVRNRELRTELGREMYRVGRERYHVEVGVKRWGDLCESLLA